MKLKGSIFKQIVTSVAIPELIIFLLVCAVSYYNLKNIFEIEKEEKLELLNKQSEIILDLRDNALGFTNNYLDLLTKNSIQNLIDHCVENEIDPSKINLKEYIRNSNLEIGMCDFYILNTEGIVVNTSFEHDLGLNFFEFGKEYEDLLRKLFDTREFHVDNFSVETKTKKLRKYAYQAMPSGEYLVEFGVYSEESKILENSVVKGLKEIVKSQQNIKAIDIIVPGYPDYYSIYNADFVMDSAEADLIDQLYHSKDSSFYKIVDNFIYDFKIFPKENNSIYKKLMVRIVYDTQYDQMLLKSELKKEILLFVVCIAMLFTILYFNVKRLVKPILNLTRKAQLVGEGNLSERVDPTGNNEITALSANFNTMVDNLQNSQNQLLQQNEEITAQTEQIEHQKNILEHSNKEITSSINYAKRIQEALLRFEIPEGFPEHFVFYRPKDIVSGDFYWVLEKKEYLYIAVADCTGHGVPGAFLAMLGSSFLSEANFTDETLNPAEILAMLRNKFVTALSQRGDVYSTLDGMDISLARLKRSNMELEWAGANNPLYLYHQKELHITKGDRQAIGYSGTPRPYTNHTFRLEKGDMIFLFSDGFADQFGGETNHKYGYRNLRDLLTKHAERSAEEIKSEITKEIDDWMAMSDSEQTDDICVLGVKIE